MQIRSLGSVKVAYLDRAKVIEDVKQAVRRLARKHPEIRKVWLFGSLARGDAVPGSDADLLIVLADSDLPFLERISRYTISGVPVGTDVFPYTEKELTRMLKEGNFFIKRALSEGTVIFQRRAS